MKVYFDMVGCRVNQAELESLAAAARTLGHEPTANVEEAELAILNTCTVTREAERDSRQKARWIHARNPAARVFVTGCWGTLAPREAARLPGVERVVSNAEKDAIFANLPSGGDTGAGRAPLPGARHRTRAFIKVEDGCNNACAYCVTRIARGPVRSRPVDAVVTEILRAEEAGAREVVLAGIHLGAWGAETACAGGLERLMETVLARTSVPRIRLSSLEPWDLAPSFFGLWADPRLCPHLHLPLQSGSPAGLRRMARRTTPETFARIVEAARAAIPDLAITSDLIVGFPGEDAAEFAESLAFTKRMDFARLHVFRFSARPGTPAAKIAGAVPPGEIRRRMKAARAAADESAAQYARRFLGREMDVLWDADPREGEWHGLTGNYLAVRVRANAPLGNTITRVRLLRLEEDYLRGEIFPAECHSERSEESVTLR